MACGRVGRKRATLGEMGLWYALCPITCLCGLVTRVGGHTPFEPAHAVASILHGPPYADFTALYPALDAMRGAARGFVAGDAGAPDALTRDLTAALGLVP